MATNLCYDFVIPVFCCILFVASATARAKVPAIYVFGDSLADVGNNDYLKLSLIKADFPHNGVDYPGGKATGRFSNGKNSADFLAEKLGVSSPPAYLSIPPDSNLTLAFLEGVSFASAGAGILDSTSTGECLSFNRQIDYFSSVYSNLVENMGSAQSQDHLSKSIFAFIVGSNDIIGYIKSSSSQDQTPITPRQLVASMTTSLRRQLTSLYNLGARKFAFVGTGLIGCCPQRRNQTDDTCNAEANRLSLRYNKAAASVLEEMKSEFSDMNYSFFDSSITMADYIQDPATYGFEEVKAACCGLGNLNAKVACLPVSSLCTNRSNHLFWDIYHPTERTAGLLTAAFYEGLPPTVYPINVKQLSAL